MLVERKFKIVLVGAGNGSGADDTGKYDKEVAYNGEKVTVKL